MNYKILCSLLSTGFLTCYLYTCEKDDFDPAVISHVCRLYKISKDQILLKFETPDEDFSKICKQARQDMNKSIQENSIGFSIPSKSPIQGSRKLSSFSSYSVVQTLSQDQTCQIITLVKRLEK